MPKNFRAPCAIVTVSVLSFVAFSDSSAQTYATQPGSVTQTLQDNGSSSFAGFYDAGSGALGVYANRNNGSTGVPQAVGYSYFTSNGSNVAGSALALQVGQSFSVTLKLNGTDRGINGNSIGFALNNGSTFTNTGNYNAGNRFEYSFTSGESSAAIYGSSKSTANLPGFSAFANGLTYTFTLVSTNEFNYTVSGAGGATYNVGTLGGTSGASIDSFSLFNRGYNNNDAIYSGIAVSNVGTIGYTANTGETKTVTGVIKNLSTGAVNSIQKLGVGVVQLQNVNTFTGSTAVSAGTLELTATGSLGGGQASHTSAITVSTAGTLLLGGGAAVTDRIHDSTGVTLSGAFNTAGLSERVGALTLASTSTIDLGNGTSSLIFGGTSTRTGGSLAISNWTLGSDHVFFYDASTGTNAYAVNFLANITINGFAVQELSSGEIVPVPEPATWLAGGLSLLGAVELVRRRLLAFA